MKLPMASSVVWLLLAWSPVATLSAQTSTLEGVWRSQGYGLVFEIKGTTLKAFEVTSTTCVPSFEAPKDSTAVAGREATFKHPDGYEFFIRAGSSDDHRILHNEGSASDVRIDRLPRLPAVCNRPTEDTPAGNFEVFTSTWAEHYIDPKKTDWTKVVEGNRSQVTPKTTPGELFDIFERMIEPFNDAHTFVYSRDLKRQSPRRLRPGTDRVIKGQPERFRSTVMPALLAVTDRAYLETPLRVWCKDEIQYGHVDEGTGYLRILSFSN